MNIKTTMCATLLALSAGLLFSGCGASYQTYATPLKNNAVNIIVNQDSTSLGPLNSGNVLRKNYRYAFAVAATATKNAGHKYFSIINPDPLIAQYKERKVETIEDAYNACDTGEGSFDMAVSHRKWMTKQNNCQSIVSGGSTVTLFGGSIVQKHAKFVVRHHNEDRKDHVTFNAQDVLNSKLVEDLDPKNFVAIKRESW